MRHAKFPRLRALRGINGEFGHLCLVETVEGQHPGVRGPPEGPVMGTPSENLLVIDPGRIAVVDDVAAVGSHLHGLPVRCPFHIQIPLLRIGLERPVRREGRILPQREFIAFQHLVLRGHPAANIALQIGNKSPGIAVRPVIAERRLRRRNPLPLRRHLVQSVLSRRNKRQQQ